jgi:Zn-finger in ubiquitin-hydrolases and other protein
MILAMPSPTCTHLDQIEVSALPDALVACCDERLKTGDHRLHLRKCMTCRQIGCCDSSPNRRAPRHAESERPPIAGSAEPGEEWSWPYVDEVALVVGE